VAHALADLAPRVGFAVEHFTSTEAFAKLSPHTPVVVATQGRGDLPALRAALAATAATTWFVASARKAAVLKDNLRTAGHDSAAVDAIIAPAGTPIGAQTPEEIALSVLAAVIAHQRGAMTPSASTAPSPAAAVPEAAAAPQKSCCGG
jgi:xanthine dehydrogenase accessory factor